MAEKAPHTHEHGHGHTQGHGHGYLPAMGHDRLLRLYDPFTRLLGVRPAHRRLAAQAGIGPGDRVLEIGTGTGNLALLVAREYPGADVVGLDPDPRALAMARRKAARRGRRVQWDLGTAAELPYPDESMDRVLSSLMFHHLDEDEKRRTLTEVRRVLKPGGSVHLMDFGGSTKPGPIIRMMQRRNPLLHSDGRAAISEHARAAGLSDVAEIDDRAGMVYFRATR